VQKLTKLQSSTLVLCILHNNVYVYFHKEVYVITFNYKVTFILEYHKFSQDTQHCIFEKVLFHIQNTWIIKSAKFSHHNSYLLAIMQENLLPYIWILR